MLRLHNAKKEMIEHKKKMNNDQMKWRRVNTVHYYNKGDKGIAKGL